MIYKNEIGMKIEVPIMQIIENTKPAISPLVEYNGWSKLKYIEIRNSI